MKLYEKKYHKIPDTVEIEGFEIPVRIPIMPPLEEMMNYGLPEEQQYFKLTKLPDNLASMKTLEQEPIIAEEWHKRWNGVWVLIKGKPTYITGAFYVFLNYWEIEAGGLPEYRKESWDLFMIWDHIEHDNDCYGLSILKPRRIGDTEKCLFLGWERVTRYRNSHFGQMNKKGDDAVKNFDRLVAANKKMPFFFRPVNLNNDAPGREIIYRYPGKKITATSMKEEAVIEYTEPELGSRCTYENTVFKAYDGQRLSVFLFDEWAKIPLSQINMAKQLEIVKPCVALKGNKLIVGKLLLPSTVEDDERGSTMTAEQVMQVVDLWQDSDPRERNLNNRTKSGLYRYFRGHKHLAEANIYGEQDYEAQELWHTQELEMMRKGGKMHLLTDYLRKFPRTPEDSLKIPAAQCVLYPELLDEQSVFLDVEEAGMRHHEARLEVRGDLLWLEGFGGRVKWFPNPQGRFWMSQAPTEMNNIFSIDGKKSPKNFGKIAIGIDPVDHKMSEDNNHPSKPAIAVFRLYDDLVDGELNADDEGSILTEDVSKMMTDQFVMTYEHRSYSPEEFYEDSLKCAIFWGAQCLVERNKPGVLNYFEKYGFIKFLASKPRKAGEKRKKTQSNEVGAHEGGALVASYTPSLQIFLVKRYRTLRHRLQIENFRRFNGSNQGSCDLLVASGLALMLAESYGMKKIKEDKNKWSRPPWATAPRNISYEQQN